MSLPLTTDPPIVNQPEDQKIPENIIKEMPATLGTFTMPSFLQEATGNVLDLSSLLRKKETGDATTPRNPLNSETVVPPGVTERLRALQDENNRLTQELADKENALEKGTATTEELTASLERIIKEQENISRALRLVDPKTLTAAGITISPEGEVHVQESNPSLPTLQQGVPKNPLRPAMYTVTPATQQVIPTEVSPLATNQVATPTEIAPSLPPVQEVVIQDISSTSKNVIPTPTLTNEESTSIVPGEKITQVAPSNPSLRETMTPETQGVNYKKISEITNTLIPFELSRISAASILNGKLEEIVVPEPEEPLDPFANMITTLAINEAETVRLKALLEKTPLDYFLNLTSPIQDEKGQNLALPVETLQKIFTEQGDKADGYKLFTDTQSLSLGTILFNGNTLNWRNRASEMIATIQATLNSAGISLEITSGQTLVAYLSIAREMLTKRMSDLMPKEQNPQAL